MASLSRMNDFVNAVEQYKETKERLAEAYEDYEQDRISSDELKRVKMLNSDAWENVAFLLKAV